MKDPDRPDVDLVQVVAVATECTTTSLEINIAGQESGDHIASVKWVPIDDLLSLNLVPSLRPAAEAFVARYKEYMTRTTR